MSGNITGKLGDVEGEAIETKVLILGGGAAGLSAAGTFLSQGVDSFLVLEGADHTGGRVHDIPFGGVSVEKGANWLQPGSCPVKKIADNCGLQNCRLSLENSIDIRGTDRNISFKEYSVAMDEFCNILEEATSLNSICPDQDMVLRTFLDKMNWSTKSDVLRKFVEWFSFNFEYTVSPDDAAISSGQWDRANETIHFVTDQRGFKFIFADVVARLIKKNHLLLNKRVVSIDQSQGEIIVVTCADGSVFRAEAVLLTFNLGVLQSRLVDFHPPLPLWKTAAIDHTPVGAFTKIFLKFPRKFWGDKLWIVHASDRHGYYPTFLNLEANGVYPPGTNILTGFIVGDEARRVEGQPLDDTREEIVSLLGGMYGEENVPAPTDMMLSNWLNDPLQMGAYSAPHLNTSSRVIQQLQTRVGRIYFGGEATDEKFSGFVIGAISSGEREARKIMRKIFGREIQRKGFGG